jgi:hypothetical protein
MDTFCYIEFKFGIQNNKFEKKEKKSIIVVKSVKVLRYYYVASWALPTP